MKKIKFSPAFDWVEKIDITPPMPAKNYIPKWYKDLNPYLHKEFKSVPYRLPKLIGEGTNMSAKMCIPLLDSITNGYVITMPCDIQFVDPNLYQHRVIWDVDWQVVTEHSSEQTSGFNPFNANIFEEAAFKFEGLWNIKTPKGYSLLYTHPFWNYNVPFFTSTAIVDADKYSTKINIPFFIKKNFIGLIEKDTPIAQIIPIKREKWTSKQDAFVNNFYSKNIKLKIFKSYKTRFWEKKEYN